MDERIVEMDRLLQVMEKIIKEQEPTLDVEAAIDDALQGKPLGATPDLRSKKLETLKEKHKCLNPLSPEIMVKQIEDEIRLFHTELLGTQRAPVGQETLTPTKNPEEKPVKKLPAIERCLVM